MTARKPKTCHCGCGRLNYYAVSDAERANRLTMDFCYHLPKVPLGCEPIPRELMRNLPPWVYWLQIGAHLLILPWALMLFWIMWLWPLGERIGLWHF